MINLITQSTCPPTWYRLAHADLLHELATHWHPSRFTIRKVRSHQDISSLPPGLARDDAIGNSWADHAAVRARQIDHTLMDTFVKRMVTSIVNRIVF